MDSCICQTSTVTPAEPGDYPFYLHTNQWLMLNLGYEKLTPRQARFVDEYLIDLNASQAVVRAGFSPRGANVTGSLLLVLTLTHKRGYLPHPV